MGFHRISLSDILVGSGLPWDVFDSADHLLLRKGYIIKSIDQAEALVTRGMFIEGTPDSARVAVQPAGPPVESPSVLRTLNRVVRRLGAIIKELPQLPDAQDKILEVVKMLRFAVDLNEDLALSSILINQASGAYPVRHCVDSAILAVLVAKAMKKPDDELNSLVAAALTMNIAMLGLQERLQVKKDAVSADDRDHIHRHPFTAIEMLDDAGITDANWLMYVLMHHEHEDGTGYPVGTLKSEIPVNAKILSLADGYCARVASRAYCKTVVPSSALRNIFVENGPRVDALLGAYFIKVLGLYPPGSFVKLKSEEIAVVAQRGAGPTACVVYALTNVAGEVMVTPVKRDTTKEAFAIVSAEPCHQAVRLNCPLIWGPMALP